MEQTLLIVGQGMTAEEAGAAIEAILGSVPAGIGMERRGLEGARVSLGDAERALAVSRLRGERCCYHDCWLAATLLPAKDRLNELLAPGHRAIERHPDLAQTVAAFAECGLSQSSAARQLGIHCNTAGYRLSRWAEVTGWDPRSGAGLMLSLAALETYKRTEPAR
jgi:sugar diacid utilization regulator